MLKLFLWSVFRTDLQDLIERCPHSSFLVRHLPKAEQLASNFPPTSTQMPTALETDTEILFNRLALSFT